MEVSLPATLTILRLTYLPFSVAFVVNTEIAVVGCLAAALVASRSEERKSGKYLV